ncbi:trypsin-like serine peptidase [Pararoseomonas indoligenes]|uniref:trypsin-like serine peptidase n=1 Tax=Roseomonas indoligenes TaxID=2820811 RepID=UPI003158ACB8
MAPALALLSAGPAAAEPRIPLSVLPGLGAGDARRLVDADAPPWSSLGRVQTELGSRCTGTLIGPRTVLTAAHCLVAPRTGQLLRPSSVHFLLGYRQGTWKATARAASFRTGPGFDPRTRLPRGADWAVLTLDTPIAAAPLPLLEEDPAPDQPVMLGGYQQDRPEVLMADTACRALGTAALDGLRLIVHGCAATRGASGAPLLARRPDGGWAVAGVSVAMALDVARGIAVPARALRE